MVIVIFIRWILVIIRTFFWLFFFLTIIFTIWIFVSKYKGIASSVFRFASLEAAIVSVQEMFFGLEFRTKLQCNFCKQSVFVSATITVKKYTIFEWLQGLQTNILYGVYMRHEVAKQDFAWSHKEGSENHVRYWKGSFSLCSNVSSLVKTIVLHQLRLCSLLEFCIFSSSENYPQKTPQK